MSDMHSSDWLQDLVEGGVADVSITGAMLDSRRLEPGSAFVALQGDSMHGLDFIEAALGKQPSCVVVDASEQARAEQLVGGRVPVFSVPGLSEHLPALARRLYFPDGRCMPPLIGVTGTDGKTSTVAMISQLLNRLGIPCGVIGTLGVGMPHALGEASHTTPDILSLYAALSRLVQTGAEVVAMEVSSHALAQNRVAGLSFSVATLTNVGHDHLDYHGTIDRYASAKQRLFQHYALSCVFNLGDTFGLNWARQEALDPSRRISGFAVDALDVALPGGLMVWQASDVQASADGLRFQLRTPASTVPVYLPLVGEFHVANAIAALATVVQFGVPLESVLPELSHLAPIPGRMERTARAGLPTVIVDFAHTPGGLEAALRAARAHAKRQLWVVFGCGGNRDRNKRERMGAIASRFADRVIITDDNPRHEDPEEIMRDILQGILRPDNVRCVPGRAKAIHTALNEATVDDLVLIAGKGHETYQEVRGHREPYSDQQVVQEWMQGR